MDSLGKIEDSKITAANITEQQIMNGILTTIWNTEKANLKAKVTGYYTCLYTSSRVHYMTRRQRFQRQGSQHTNKCVCAQERQRLVLWKSRAAGLQAVSEYSGSCSSPTAILSIELSELHEGSLFLVKN